METSFVHKDSIVRKIWGKADIILFIFAGSAAEFALNKAVDWLYFTGRLPADPLGRLFSTVTYARQIIFSDQDAAFKAVDKISAIHKDVEKNRGAQIPDWAYRDVLFMLIDYSIRSFELLERELDEAEKAEVFAVFNRVGQRMQLTELPGSYKEWKVMRDKHLQRDLVCGEYTIDLYHQYKKHLGLVRFWVLKQVQLLLVPKRVNELLSFGKIRWLIPALHLYKLLRIIKLDKFFKNALLPDAYKVQLEVLDIIR